MEANESGEPTAPRRPSAGRWVDRAKRIGASLRAEYRAGVRGDESPVAPIWAPPGEQLDRLLRAVRARGGTDAASEPAGAEPADTMPQQTPGDAPSADGHHADRSGHDRDDAQELARAMRGVDWAAVRASVGDRSGDVRRRLTSLAAQVDWAAVQPAAAHLSSALIAAVAAGRIPVGGPIGATVARAIVDQGGLGALVSDELRHHGTGLPPDFRDVIDTTASETPGPAS